ncbi:MAG: DUF1439 domain-containing protein [Marinicaulis sp.]|nr:DUF1439 domain-containing protein [Marinicaulis sp.]
MRIISTIILFLILASGAAFFLLKDKSYTLKFTEADIDARVSEQLPFEKDYLSIFNVKLDNPRVDLIDGAGMFGGGADAIVTVSFMGRDIMASGGTDFTSGVRYEPSEGAFYLTNPSITNLTLNGLPPTLTNRAKNAMSLALAEFYRDRPIYVLSDEDMRQQAAKMVLRDVEVKDEVLHITMGLAKDE